MKPKRHKVEKWLRKCNKARAKVDSLRFEVQVADRDEYCQELIEAEKKMAYAENKLYYWMWYELDRVGIENLQSPN